MDSALIASAALLGLAGAPHCTVMCSAPCAAAVSRGGWQATAAFQFARVAGYSAAGAAAAASVATLATWTQISPALRPAWTLLHVAALALGLWLLLRGSQPAWMANLGRPPAAMAAGAWQPVHAPARATLAGALWVGWPCGLLQSALLVAALGSGAAAGAAAMAAFGVASAPGLLLAPWIWRRMLQGGRAPARQAWAVRAGGLLLATASVWALGHDLWPKVAAYCHAL